MSFSWMSPWSTVGSGSSNAAGIRSGRLPAARAPRKRLPGFRVARGERLVVLALQQRQHFLRLALVKQDLAEAHATYVLEVVEAVHHQ